MRSEGTGTIVRVVKLLRCLAESSSDISITELSKQLGLAPSTVHRILQLLLDEGIVAKSDARSLYRPGAELVRISALISSKTQIGDLAKPAMEKLAGVAQEACLLTQLLPHEFKVMVIAAIASPHPLRYDIEMFQRSSLLNGATGRTILAFLPQDQITQALDRAEQDGDEPEFDRVALQRDLEEIKARGYTITHGQKVPGAVGIGAPVFNGNGRVVAALSLTMPEQRFDTARAEELADLVRDRAGEISVLLGHEG